MTIKRYLSDYGIRKVHWECWSECNLSCPFCYRTRSTPLYTEGAKVLIQKIAENGVRELVFTGGDPLVRDDLLELILCARQLGVNVEIHTNAHRNHPRIAEIIKSTNLFGFSLDAANEADHDSTRLKRGNFRRVISLMDTLDKVSTPYNVRTVVSKRNSDSLGDMIEVLQGRPALRKWIVMEFTAAGDGFDNRKMYELPPELTNSALERLMKYDLGKLKVDIYRNTMKMGTYFQIRSDGAVYTTVKPKGDQHYSPVGNIMKDDISEIMCNLKFNSLLHEIRYGSE